MKYSFVLSTSRRKKITLGSEERILEQQLYAEYECVGLFEWNIENYLSGILCIENYLSGIFEWNI